MEEMNHLSQSFSLLDVGDLGDISAYFCAENDLVAGKEEAAKAPTPNEVFCYLIINFCHTMKTNTHIGVSEKPEEKVQIFNEKKASKLRNSDSSAHVQTEPFWKLAMVIGPFINEDKAVLFQDVWGRARGIPSRMEKGLQLSIEFNTKLTNLPEDSKPDDWEKYLIRCYDNTIPEDIPAPPPTPTPKRTHARSASCGSIDSQGNRLNSQPKNSKWEV